MRGGPAYALGGETDVSVRVEEGEAVAAVSGGEALRCRSCIAA
jgi:hypothetical protein